MPIYNYTCLSCNHQFERYVQKMDTPVVACPECGQDSKRSGFEPVSPFVWGKGGGWA